MAKKSQTEQILQYMKEIGGITPLDALNLYGCFRLGARIWDLRYKGYNIRTETISRNGKKFAMYHLED